MTGGVGISGSDLVVDGKVLEFAFDSGRIVDDFDDLHPNLCILPHWAVTAISLVPGGAHPSYAHGYYKRDNPAYLDWDRVSGDRHLFQEWMEENVMKVGPEIFAVRAGLTHG